MTDTTTTVIEPNPFPEDMMELTEVARRLLNHSADCMHADGRPVTAQEMRKLGEALYKAARAQDAEDAARYRWLISQDNEDFMFAVVKNPHFDVFGSAAELTAAIDAARAKEGKA